MAYDEELAERIRALAHARATVTEQRMFGGLAFLVHGNMAVAASGQGGLLLRADPEEGDALVASGEAEAFVMRGRPMAGWLRVPPERVEDEAELAVWVERGLQAAQALPPKPGR